jgi:hypothetical protein
MSLVVQITYSKRGPPAIDWLVVFLLLFPEKISGVPERKSQLTDKAISVCHPRLSLANTSG